MILDDILEANRAFLQNFRAEHLDHKPQKQVAVLACMDARLSDGFIEKALGLKRGDAVILRTAGNNLLDREVLRSLVVGVFLQGIQDIIVLGHTDCGMSKIDLVQLTNAMRARGVVREKLPGVSDIRQWLGAFGNVESNVRETVGHLRASPFLPRDIRVHGLVINSDTGELKVVERGK